MPSLGPIQKPGANAFWMSDVSIATGGRAMFWTTTALVEMTENARRLSAK